jgi:predicted RNA binding protein YcfA (HicA-like mRNA interferase family)
MKYSELERVLIQNGCYLMKEGGNHSKWFSPITRRRFLLGRHKGEDVPKGTLNKILKESGSKL